jgi:hypothetical protein
MQTDTFSIPRQPSARRAWLITAMSCLLIGVGLLLLQQRMINITIVSSDFTQDYVAGLALREGRSIYSPFTPADIAAEKLGMGYTLYTPYGFANNHPPFDTVLFLPFTLLPYDQAIMLWSGLSLLLYLLCGELVLRELKIELARHWKLLLVGLALCWYPFQAHIALGQWSMLIVAGVLGCWALLRRRRDTAAGVLLGIACLIKLFPGMIVLYLLLRRRWRAAGAACATMAVGGLLTLAIVGVDDMLEYVRRVAPLDAIEFAPAPINHSLTAVFHRLFGDGAWVVALIPAPWVIPILVALSGLGLAGLLAYQVWRTPPTQRGHNTTFALACIAMLLASPITWQHIFPILICPLGLLLLEQRERFDGRRLALALVALAILSIPDIEIGRALMRFYEPYRAPWYAGLPMSLPTIGLLIMGWLLFKKREFAGQAAHEPPLPAN